MEAFTVSSGRKIFASLYRTTVATVTADLQRFHRYDLGTTLCRDGWVMIGNTDPRSPDLRQEGRDPTSCQTPYPSRDLSIHRTDHDLYSSRSSLRPEPYIRLWSWDAVAQEPYRFITHKSNPANMFARAVPNRCPPPKISTDHADDVNQGSFLPLNV